MIEYVLGFMFDSQKNVALIQKNRPAWQAGLLNGIGGKIENGESPNFAMSREFFEETGFRSDPSSWYRYVVYTGKDFIIHIFYRYGPLEELTTTTDEKVSIIKYADINSENTITNIPWLINMALSMEREHANIFYIHER